MNWKGLDPTAAGSIQDGKALILWEGFQLKFLCTLFGCEVGDD
eukprot:CAMPEP_0181535168 /NCGR_PEP_ID=MMETSP1110-20121109/74117_1 /TAXON_ID=174948 /ORGANISM="Symbiodinium sp., Strain CCMP421" /LENGTH=42 /DNA_ID= /DNA_START= /DNA_END= /DNA_ORIENTATION=